MCELPECVCEKYECVACVQSVRAYVFVACVVWQKQGQRLLFCHTLLINLNNNKNQKEKQSTNVTQWKWQMEKQPCSTKWAKQQQNSWAESNSTRALSLCLPLSSTHALSGCLALPLPLLLPLSLEWLSWLSASCKVSSTHKMTSLPSKRAHCVWINITKFMFSHS